MAPHTLPQQKWNDHKLWRGALALLIALSCFRFAHASLLWADEDYHLAAALQLLHGKIPYRDFWYDKPPLSAIYYVLIGAHTGWMLRLLDAGYIVATGVLLSRIALLWWGRLEACAAAVLFGFYTTFYLPSAVIPFAADAVMMLPHVAAIYCVVRKKPLLAGAWCGLAFLANAKALFVLLTCAAWLPLEVAPLLGGFVLVAGAGCGVLWIAGAWNGYVEQVWRWGVRYAAGSPVAHPFLNGLSRTANWLGFHATLAVGTIIAVKAAARIEKRRLLIWIIASFAAVALGSRFAPHYFLQLLPPLIVAASRGIVVSIRARPRLVYIVFATTMLLPLARFGPRYATLLIDDLRGPSPQWNDVAMDLDSQRAAAFINSRKRDGDTLFVWGYRPDLYMYTRLVSDGLFWDSQPITGVAADRHLQATTTIYSEAAMTNRLKLAETHPTWLIDGLGLMNPKLRPQAYADLSAWLSEYEQVGKTELCVIYRRRSSRRNRSSSEKDRSVPSSATEPS